MSNSVRKSFTERTVLFLIALAATGLLFNGCKTVVPAKPASRPSQTLGPRTGTDSRRPELTGPARQSKTPSHRQVNAVIINADQKIGTINPNIYGHFTEHLGHCIYGGIWVGPNSPIENVRGIRTDVVQALRKIKPSIVRWPGGCFADSYHWRDGIGKRRNRPKRINYHWGGVIENNHFGTSEFIDFCRQIGAEPFIAANVGTGTPKEMRDWLEYLNFNGDSTLAELRAQNGHPEPFYVKYLGVGNENWGCGGSMDPIHYARLYRRFSEFSHFFGTSPSGEKTRLYKVACGPSGGSYKWTRNFFELMSGRKGDGRNRLSSVNAFDMHCYTSSKSRYGTATEYTPDQWYGLLAKSLRIEDLILKHWDIMKEYDPRHRVKLAVCEWGAWHKVMPGTNRHFLRQQNTMRDALLAALTLNVFNRQCDKVDMANIAQMINVLQAMILTDGPRMFTTPTYHVFEMYVPHQGADALRCDVSTQQIHFTDRDKPKTLPRITASCSRKDDTITVSLVNTHATSSTTVLVCLRGVARAELQSWRVLAADDIHAHNTFDQPNRVVPHNNMPGHHPLIAATGYLTLPPASVNVLTYTIKD